MNRLEIAVASLGGKDPEKAHSDISAACNTYGLDVNGFLELVRQNQKTAKIWTDICWHWIKSLAKTYETGGYDPRNQQSCYIGWQLQWADNEKFEPLPNLSRDDFIAVFIRLMAYDHKTLQQSFSSLVFAWLKYLAEEKGDRKAKHAAKRVREDTSDYWYRMPMI